MARQKRMELHDSSYIHIQGWMARLTTKDGRVLSLPELIIFANIFGYSQDCKSRYHGGISYLMAFLHLSKPTVLAHLSTLEESGLIGRYELENGDVDYFVLTSVIDSIGKKILPVKNLNRLNTLTKNGKESLPFDDSDLYYNNKKYNKDSAPADAAACAGTAAAIFVDLEESDIVSEKENSTPLPPSAAATRAASKTRAEKKATAFDFRAALIGLGVTEEVADAWLTVRKARRAVNSEIAFNRIASEIAKAANGMGFNADQCIRRAVEKSWQGFEARWLDENRFNSPSNAMAVTPARRHTGPVPFND